MIMGERVTLRRIEEKDLDLIVKWRNDPEILKWLFSYLPLSKEKEQKWYEKYLDDDTQLILIIELKERKRAIGTIGLTKIDHKNQKGELTIIIGEKKYWGEGLGEECLNLIINYAYKEMNLRKIKALVFSDNERAIKLYEKCGFVKEEVLKREIYKNGMFKDIILMSKFRKKDKK